MRSSAASDDYKRQGLAELKSALIELLPTLTNYLYEQAHNSKEEQNFLKLKTEILWYAGVAGGAGAIPGVGIVSVPTLQGKMLHSLAKQYGIEWNRTEFLEFVGAMGSGFAFQYALSLIHISEPTRPY